MLLHLKVELLKYNHIFYNLTYSTLDNKLIYVISKFVTNLIGMYRL